MSSQIEVGNIVTGKVTGIQPYGAFVALNDSMQGLVHISEITHGYVKDIHDYLKIGDEVTVKILSIDKDVGKISLSIRATKSAPEKTTKKVNQHQRLNPIIGQLDNEDGFNTLKEKLSEWIEQSERDDLIKR